MPSSSGTFVSSAGFSIFWEKTLPSFPSQKPGLFWLGGLKSDLLSTKAQTLSHHAEKTGVSYLGFEYSGHGRSDGLFEEQTVSHWIEEAFQAFQALSDGPQILVGSSLGGWIALLLVKKIATYLPSRLSDLRGLILLAPAVDMTEALMWETFSAEERAQLFTDGVVFRPSLYDPQGYPLSKALIEDGRQHCLLSSGLALPCPLRILHGDCDPDVPWSHGLKIFHALSSPDASFLLFKGGDHRLSAPPFLKSLCETIDGLSS